MKRLFVLSGLAGTKTSDVVAVISQAHASRLNIRDLDSYLPEHEKNDDWRLSAYRLFIEDASKGDDNPWILAGQIVFPEFDAVAAKSGFADVRYLAITVDEKQRVKNLRNEGWPADLIEGHRAWARKNFLDANATVKSRTLNVSNTSPQDVGNEVVKWVLTS
jgi:hypothetical protein